MRANDFIKNGFTSKNNIYMYLIWEFMHLTGYLTKSLFKTKG